MVQKRIEKSRVVNKDKLQQLTMEMRKNLNNTQQLIVKKCDAIENDFKSSLKEKLSALELYSTNLNNKTSSKLTQDFDNFSEGLVDFTNDIKFTVADVNDKLHDLQLDVENLDSYSNKALADLNTLYKKSSAHSAKKYKDLEQRQHDAINDMHTVKGTLAKLETQSDVTTKSLQNLNLSDQLVAAESRMNTAVAEIKSNINNQLLDVIKRDEYVSNTTEIKTAMDKLASSQEQLETDFVQYQFDIEDNFAMFGIDMNETVLDLRSLMESAFQEEIARTETLLTDEITNKLNKLNDNMKKFSDVSSMGANELRGLIESEIVELQVKVSDIVERTNIFKNDVTNTHVTINEKISDIEKREQSYEANLLDISNGLELSKSSFSDFRLRSSQKMALNVEKLEGQDQAIRDILETVSGFEWKLSESSEKVTQNENKILEAGVTRLDNKNNIQGLLKQHTVDREHIVKQRARLQKSQEQLELHADKLDTIILQVTTAESAIARLARLDGKIKKNTETDEKIKTLINSMTKNITEYSRVHRRDMTDMLSKFDSNSNYLDNRITSEINEVAKSTVRNAKDIIKTSKDLTAQEEATATIIDSRLTEDETKLSMLNEQFNKRKLEVQQTITSMGITQKDLLTMTEILTETSRQLSQEFKNLDMKTDKKTQILEDKLSLPIDIQKKKHASLEQLVVSELERLENRFGTLKNSQQILNTTLSRLGSTVITHEGQVLKSMENNRRIFGQLGKQMNTMEVRKIQSETLINELENDMDRMMKIDLPKFKANFEKAFKNVCFFVIVQKLNYSKYHISLRAREAHLFRV